MKYSMKVRRKGSRMFYLYGTTDDLEYIGRQAERMLASGVYTAVKAEEVTTGRKVAEYTDTKKKA